LDKQFVLVVSHAASLINDGSQRPDHGVINIVTGIVDHHLELVLGHFQVGVREVLGRRGPADRAELLAVNQHCVEDRSAEEQGLEERRVLARIHPLVGELRLGVEHHLLDVARGLNGQFDALLQDRNREVWYRGSGQEESEVAVGVGRLEFLNHFLEFRHPRDLQVCVLEEQPLTAVRTPFELTLGHWPLALSEGDLIQIPAGLL